MSCRTRPAHEEDMEAVRALFRAYQAHLGIDVCFQGFERELASLPGPYAPPGGAIVLGEMGGKAVGVVALVPLDPDTAEMKRLFVVPEHQGSGLGRELVEAVLADARTKGYRKVRLHTLPTMKQAVALYRRLGFQEVEPGVPDPVPGALYFERPL